MAEQTTGFSVGKLFEDSNFIQMLAGVGAEMDPEGAGGILGRAATTMSRNKAAQSAAGKQLEEGRREREELRTQHRQLLDRLGPVTAPDKVGLNSLKQSKNGTVDIDINPADHGKLVSDLGGFTPLEEPGINSITRSPRGSTLVNYTLPKRTATTVASEVEGLAASPTAVRDRNNLSYTPVSQTALQSEIDGILDPYTGRRRYA